MSRRKSRYLYPHRANTVALRTKASQKDTPCTNSSFQKSRVRSDSGADREDTHITRMDHSFESVSRTEYVSKSLCFCVSGKKCSMDLEHDWMAEMAGIERCERYESGCTCSRQRNGEA